MSTPPLRVEITIDARWIKWFMTGALALVGLGFLWLFMVVLRAVINAANDVALAIQHAHPTLQVLIALFLFAALLYVVIRLTISGWKEWKGGAV